MLCGLTAAPSCKQIAHYAGAPDLALVYVSIKESAQMSDSDDLSNVSEELWSEEEDDILDADDDDQGEDER